MDKLTSRFFPGSRAYLAVIALMCADILALLVAMALSLLLGNEAQPLASTIGKFHDHLVSLPFVLGLYLTIFAWFHLYRYAWRFASIEMVWGVASANSLGLVGLITLQYLFDETIFPRNVLIIFWFVSIFLVGLMRIVLRVANISRKHGPRALRTLRRDVRPKRVVILGGGSDGARLLSSLREDVTHPYVVVGLLDDTPHKQGIYIRGARVLGPLQDLYRLLDTNAVDEVLIALPSASGADIREYVMACRKQKVSVKVIPGLHDVLGGKARARLEEVSVEDLLRRPPVNISIAGIGSYVTGRRVLVTGAGGSIGSELCRQILALNPAELVLLGHGENSIHGIYQELTRAYPQSANRLHTAIGSVADDARMDQIIQAHHPHVVFHAAAHKHVPIMEVNVQEAVQNNVLGTRCIADACGRAGVERMVLISTDKAVYPSSVMGATKWLCEETVRAFATIHPRTVYVTVRFGNVLGSRGSVVPIFREQIKRGGPVTVTHPEMTRFFMTIPEAVQLVLQAGAIGTTGDLFLLDMGKPVKILDLARDMIRLSGLEPDVDIPIAYTGLRPGEKLHELLATDDETIEPASCGGLSVVRRRQYFTPSNFFSILRRLQQLSVRGDMDELLDFLGEVVPAFATHRYLEDVPTTIIQELTSRP